jgi:hypothetical protein
LAHKYRMQEFKLYTLVDITHTRQHRPAYRNTVARWQEQNFNTLIQTLGIRANISYYNSPIMIQVRGRLVGFDTDEIIRVWRFDFNTEQDCLYESEGDPIGLLKADFNLIPYIQGLNELMEQKYAVFVSSSSGKNIVFSINTTD